MGVFRTLSNNIKNDMASGNVTAAIYGVGRIGLPIAAVWLNAGARVIGVDINDVTVARLNKGDIPFDDEPMIREIIKQGLKDFKFYATVDGVEASKKSDVKIIMIPTTLNLEKKLDNDNLINVLKTIGKGLKKGDVVIIECTVPPLTTEYLAKPILENESGLVAERDFGLSFSPERVSEGTAVKDIEENYPKVVGGIGPLSVETVASLYDCIAKKGTIRMQHSRDAETSKIFEGIYRDVNIALANELAIACTTLGIDFIEARKAANSQPYCHLHMPGIGVGGICIPIYPYFMMALADKSNIKTPIIRLSRKINEDMPYYTYLLIKKALIKAGIKPKKAKVGILGLTFRGNINDTRKSPSIDLITILKNKVSAVKAYDPLVLFMDGIDTCGKNELMAWADVLVFATDHDEFKNLDLCKYSKKIIIIDGRNILDPNTLPENTLYIGIGRPFKNTKHFLKKDHGDV